PLFDAASRPFTSHTWLCYKRSRSSLFSTLSLHDALPIYFFSGQKGLYRQIGAYFTIDIEKKSPSSPILNIDNPKIKLTFVDSSDKKDYKLYLLEDIVEQRDMIKTHMGDFDSVEVYENIKKHMRRWIPDLDIS